jgi:hypothetical protein
VCTVSLLTSVNCGTRCMLLWVWTSSGFLSQLKWMHLKATFARLLTGTMFILMPPTIILRLMNCPELMTRQRGTCSSDYQTRLLHVVPLDYNEFCFYFPTTVSTILEVPHSPASPLDATNKKPCHNKLSFHYKLSQCYIKFCLLLSHS